MHASDLDHKELLELDPTSGVIRFANQRVVIVDCVALGLLRKYLVESFGYMPAQTVLTQFGFAQGWRSADAVVTECEIDDQVERIAAGVRLGTLQGLFRFTPGDEDPLSTSGSMLLHSYEAQQHVLHFGQADAPMCWTICGILSGYMSRVTQRGIYVLEDRCTAKGDAACHVVGRTRAEWGDERAPDLRFFDPRTLQEGLDVSLRRVAESLKAAEQKLRHHRRALVHVMEDTEEPSGSVAKSPQMAKLVDLANRVAKVDSTLLITGESGVGKERIARLVHESSARSDGPFISLNCGAVTESLLEDELFGHMSGAFSGASSDRPGLFESANRGTLLLDEIGEVSPGMQVKLLRVLQEREIRRIGENSTRSIDVRVIAATNRKLSALVADGEFRQDLFYRLNVVELQVPALRDRREDILPLARLLLAEAGLRLKRSVTTLSPAVADQILRYAWPGNVRELQNAMERAVVLCKGSRVELEDLPEEARQAFPNVSAVVGSVLSLQEVEKQYIISALQLNGGNQTRTAAQLNIGSATLYRKLKKYGMTSTNAPKARGSAVEASTVEA